MNTGSRVLWGFVGGQKANAYRVHGFSQKYQNVGNVKRLERNERQNCLKLLSVLPLAYPKISSDYRYGYFLGSIFYKHGIFSPTVATENENTTAAKRVQFPLISYLMRTYWISKRAVNL